MRILKVYTNDIANGKGIRVSVWCSGCEHKCPECHNPETWGFDQGLNLSESLIEKILRACEQSEIDGLTLTGGDPLHPVNIAGAETLAKRFKERFPSKSVWVWTGYNLTSEELQTNSIYQYIDVLVDGKYVHKLRDVTLPYSGSTNQRVIDVQKSRAHNTIECIDVKKTAKIHIHQI